MGSQVADLDRGAMVTLPPSGIAPRCSTSWWGRIGVKTRTRPWPGGAVDVKPGSLASASSTAAEENWRPTCPVGIAHDAAQQGACCFLESASGSVRANVHSSLGPYPQRSPELTPDQLRLASMSKPVRMKVTALRKPPRLFSDTLSDGGGVSPRPR